MSKALVNIFPAPLRMEHIFGTSKFKLIAPFIYKDIKVPTGFVTDGGTKPRFTWITVGHPYDECLEAYVIHDFMCESPELYTRKEANHTFLTIMEEMGVYEGKREIMFHAVSLLEKGDIENVEDIYTIGDVGGLSDTD